MEENKKLLDLIKEFEIAVEEEDNEAAHGLYDAILYSLALQQDKKTVELINKIRNGMSFWYA